MLDPYLLTAPILLLAIVILLRFVGCSFTAGAANTTTVSLTVAACNGIAILNWTVTNPPANSGVSYQIVRYNTPLPSTVTNATYTDTGRTNGTTYVYSVNVLWGGTVYATSNSVSATPAALPGRAPGSVLDPNNSLSENLIGLFLMNEGTGTDEGQAAGTDNIVDGVTATAAGSVLPTWEVGDPSIVFYGGPSLASYLNAQVDPTFDDMPTSQITIVAKVLVNAGAAAICEKNDGNPIPGGDSGFVFGVTATNALRFVMELSQTNMKIQSADGVVPVQHWVQVAFTWDGTQSTPQNPGPASAAGLYINGVLQTPASETNGTGNLDHTRASNQNPFRIGNASYESVQGSFYGKIAYMAIYKGRLLSPSELTTLDNQLPIIPLKPQCP
jgi:Concanavalin A-like lectin/glucanases superfamily